MTNCTVRARDQVQIVAREFDSHPRVRAVDIVDPVTKRTQRWTIDAILFGEESDPQGHDGLHPSVLSILAEYGLTLHSFQPRGADWSLVAVA